MARVRSFSCSRRDMRADIHSLGVATWWGAVRRILGEGWDDAMKEPRVASGGRVQSCVAIQSGESYHGCHVDKGFEICRDLN
jgi:hypothetical protein